MTFGDLMHRCADSDGVIRDLPIVLVDEKGGWTNVNATVTNGHVALTVDKSRPFTSDGCPAELQPVRERMRDYLIERCKDFIPHAPMVLPEVVAYLEREKSGDWTSYKDWDDDDGYHPEVIEPKQSNGGENEQR